MYLKNIPAKFHPDPVWTDESLGFSKRSPQQEEEEEEEDGNNDDDDDEMMMMRSYEISSWSKTTTNESRT